MTQSKDSAYDVVIVGGGAAGFTAGMYTARRGLRTAIISKDVGGQAALTSEIENYPGLGLVEGGVLMQRFLDNAVSFGVDFFVDEVVSLHAHSNGFVVQTKQHQYQALAVILAFGLTPRSLDVAGASDFEYRGVSYCAHVDGPQYQGKSVAVIGGGNGALTAADMLSNWAAQVHLVHRRDRFTGEHILLDRVAQNKKIIPHYNQAVTAVLGDKQVCGIAIASVDDSSITEQLDVKGVFVQIGFLAKTSWLGPLVEYTTTGHISTDGQNHTITPGLFAAGDVTDIPYKQVIISAGDGAKAGLAAYAYVQEKKGLRATTIDWGVVGSK